MALCPPPFLTPANASLFFFSITLSFWESYNEYNHLVCDLSRLACFPVGQNAFAIHPNCCMFEVPSFKCWVGFHDMAVSVCLALHLLKYIWVAFACLLLQIKLLRTILSWFFCAPKFSLLWDSLRSVIIGSQDEYMLSLAFSFKETIRSILRNWWL